MGLEFHSMVLPMVSIEEVSVAAEATRIADGEDQRIDQNRSILFLDVHRGCL